MVSKALSDAVALADSGRVGEAIAQLRARMAHDPNFADKVLALDKTVGIDLEEHATYQHWQAAAFAEGKLSEGEALFIFRSLGEDYTESNGGWARNTDTATKVVVTRAIAELLGF